MQKNQDCLESLEELLSLYLGGSDIFVNGFFFLDLRETLFSFFLKQPSLKTN